MSKQITSSTDQKEHIHRRTQWVTKCIEKQKKQMTLKNCKVLLEYNDDMIIHSVSENTRYKNPHHFGIMTKILQKDWIDVTEENIRALVTNIMIKHGENGKERAYTFVLKMSLKAIVRFVK